MQPVLGVSESLTGRAWAWRGRGPLTAGTCRVAGVSDLTAGLLLARGAAENELARCATPRLRDWLPDPSVLADMDAGAERLADAVTRGEHIAVFGDYDVDGATSAALLIRFLRGCGVDARAYIPDRLLEGYGPSPAALEQLHREGASLVICVDCGAQAFEPLAHARALGLDVIVADHHQCLAELPAAAAIVNPNRIDQAPGFGHLAAVGVSFLLAVATNRALRARGWFAARTEPDLLALIDLVALGTVADVVPLHGLNRAFVAQGLKRFAGGANAGLAALAAIASAPNTPNARDLGFLFGPRINAGGRVGQADLGVRLLTTDCPREAETLARQLDRHNAERRAIEASVTEAALAAADADAPVAVVAGEGWHAGVIGIAAARVKERLNRPAIVIGLDGAIGKGSGRSLAGVDLGGAIIAAREAGLLIAGGGHAMAAGLTIDRANVAALTRFLGDRLGPAVAAARAGGALKLDLAVAPGGLTAALADELALAGPYGAGWPHPRVAAGPFAIVDRRVVGNGHLRLVLAGADGARVKAVMFRGADGPVAATLAQAHGRRVHVAGEPKRDDWAGGGAAELHLDDVAWALPGGAAVQAA
jgi:single-stranded-DNA-specific exonuclease